MHIQTLVLPALTLFTTAFAQSNVINLTPDNFDAEVFAGKPSLVEFYAPWCGHCKKLAPTWEELADSFQSAKSSVSIAKVDGDAHKSLGQQYGISGFPTIKYFDGTSKDPVDYTGGRGLEDLQDFIAEKASVRPKRAAKLPSDMTHLGDKDFDKAIGGDRGVFVAFTAPWCGHCKTLAPVWEQLAHVFNGDKSSVTIAKVDAEANKAVSDSQGISGYPTIKYFPKGTKEPIDFSSGRDLPSLVEYVNEQAGLHRLVSGSLDLKAGTLEAYDSLVQGVSATTVDDVLKKVQEAAASASDVGTEYYVKVLEKLKANSGYLEKESSRIRGLLEKGGLAKPKEDNLTRRLNVLTAFMKGEKTTDELREEL